MRRRQFEMPSQPKSFALNITSMTDMFTLLLVFLLQNYATTSVQIEQKQGLTLPQTSSEKSPNQVPQIVLSKETLQLDGVDIATLDQGQIAGTDASDPRFHRKLYEALKQKLSTEAEPTGEFLLHADSQVSYNEVRKILYTASMAGFPKAKMLGLLGANP